MIDDGITVFETHWFWQLVALLAFCAGLLAIARWAAKRRQIVHDFDCPKHARFASIIRENSACSCAGPQR